MKDVGATALRFRAGTRKTPKQKVRKGPGFIKTPNPKPYLKV